MTQTSLRDKLRSAKKKLLFFLLKISHFEQPGGWARQATVRRRKEKVGWWDGHGMDIGLHNGIIAARGKK